MALKTNDNLTGGNPGEKQVRFADRVQREHDNVRNNNHNKSNKMNAKIGYLRYLKT